MNRRSSKTSRLGEFHKPLWYDVTAWLVALPRLLRILLSGLFGLAVTFAISPLVDYIYLSYMFTTETRILPSLFSAGAGVIMYLVGWWLMIGGVGEKPPVRRAVLWYVILGTGAIILVIALSIFGWTSATATL